MYFEDIPDLYEGSSIYCILYSNCKTKEDFMDKYGDSIRDDSPICDENDLCYTFQCLMEWTVNHLPKIVLDYVDTHLDNDYSKYEENFPIYYKLIMERVKQMKKSSSNN